MPDPIITAQDIIEAADRAQKRDFAVDTPRLAELYNGYWGVGTTDQPVYYRVFYELAQKFRSYVELGVRTGGLSMHLLSGNLNLFGYGFDVEDRNLCQDIREHKRFTFFKSDSCDPNKIAQIGRPVDLVVIDADHRYEPLKREFNTWKQHLIPGGVIAIDDLRGYPDLLRFWHELNCAKIELPFLHPQNWSYGFVWPDFKQVPYQRL